MRFRGLKKYALGAGAMLVLVMAILLATGSGSAVAAQITNVFVTNDAAHPVPVHEQGTAAVRSANTELSFTRNFFSDNEACFRELYRVPADKTLILEYVASRAIGQQPALAWIERVTGDPGDPDILIPLIYVAQPDNVQMASHTVHYAIPAGSVLNFLGRNPGATFCNFHVAVTSNRHKTTRNPF